MERIQFQAILFLLFQMAHLLLEQLQIFVLIHLQKYQFLFIIQLSDL